MKKKLSNTWVIISIGKRKYAINSEYIKGIVDYSKCKYVAESLGSFSKGIYNILGMDLVVLDGHRIAREESSQENRLIFLKDMTSIKINFNKVLDSVELAVIYCEAEFIDSSAKEALKDIQFPNIDPSNTSLNKMIGRLQQNITVYVALAAKLVKNRVDGAEDLCEATKDIDKLRSDAKKNVDDLIDSIVEAYNKSVTEMCLIVSTNSDDFALTFDKVEKTTEITGKVNINDKRTLLSAGTLTIGGTNYNVLNLTKIASII